MGTYIVFINFSYLEVLSSDFCKLEAYLLIKKLKAKENKGPKTKARISIQLKLCD